MSDKPTYLGDWAVTPASASAPMTTPCDHDFGPDGKTHAFCR